MNILLSVCLRVNLLYLDRTYLEVEQKYHLSNKQGRNFWKDEYNQREFLDKVAKEFNITCPEEWNKVTIKDINSKGNCLRCLIFIGGAKLIWMNGGSLFRTLQSVYSGMKIENFHSYLETNWKKEWFSNLSRNRPCGYWNLPYNQRKYMDDLAIQLNIRNPEDWGKIPTSKITENGGHSLLLLFGGSLYHILRAVYQGFHFHNMI